MGLRGTKLRVAITLTAVTGFSLFGYDQGLMSGIITAPQFWSEFPSVAGKDRHATVVQGAVTACYEIGCFFGAVGALFFGDKTGRRPIVLLGSVLMVIGTIISVVAFGPHFGLGQFVIGRVISGIGNGMNTATIPVWQSELSKAHNRGLLVSFEGSVIAVGTFIAYWIDFGCSYDQTSFSWRFPVAFQIVFAVAVFFGMLYLPESPRWLIGQGRIEEATHVLREVAGEQESEDEIKAEMKVMQESVRQLSNQGGFSELLTGGKTNHRGRMLIGASTQFFQQFTGCNAAIYYSTVLFSDSLGQSRRLSLVLGGIFATIYAIATTPAFFLIERLGRRPLFLIGASGQGISFIITFACLAAGGNHEQNAKGAAVGLYLFIVFFAFTILQLPWVYPPEINPMRTRTAATSVSTCTNWISNFAVVMFTPVFIQSSQWGAYLFFAVMNFVWVPIIYFFYPETKQRTLEEVDLIFAKAYEEKKFAFRVANDMPKLSSAEIGSELEKSGLTSSPSKNPDSDEEKQATGTVEGTERNSEVPSTPSSSHENAA
ncbi:hypothetical protein L7F22_003288 [Adiantum nelumboides]|nr:hypothetical protein [Adiantum nelumboides]